MCLLSVLNNCARAQLAWQQLTLRNHLNLYEVIFQRQFVYFIAGIGRNILRSFIRQFLLGKAIRNFPQLLLPKTLTKYQKIRNLSLSP